MANNETKIIISADDKTGAAFASIKSGLTSITASYASLSALMTAGAAGGMIAMIKHSVDFGDKLNDLSKQTGITVEALGGLGYAGQLNGVGLEEVAKGSVKLSKNMAEAASGTGKAESAFSAMGLSVKDADGHLKHFDEMLKEVADKFALYEDSPEKAALAVRIFGKEGAALIPMLDEGAAGLRKAQEEFAKYSGVTKSAAEQSDAFNDKMEKLKLMTSGTGTVIAAELLPTMNNLTDALLDFKENSNSAGIAAGELGFGLKSLVAIGLGATHVFSEAGKELGAIAAASVAFATGSFSQASEIMKMRGEDNAKANEDLARQINKVWEESGDKQVKTAENTSKKIRAPLLANLDIGKQLENSYQSAMNTLGGDNAKLEAEIKWMADYGVSVAFANKALFEFETTRGKFKDLGLEKKAGLITGGARKDQLENAKKDEKDYQEFQKKLNEDSQTQNNEYQRQRYDTVFNSTRELADENRRMAAESILDEHDRSLAMLDIEKEKWLNIISLSADGSEERKKIETEYQAWLAGKASSIQMGEWKKTFSSMETIGKEAFVNVFTRDGKSAAESLGKAIQTSVIDLLYELTVKKWIVQIETDIVGSMAKSSSGFDGGIISAIASFFSGGIASANGNVFSGAGISAYSNQIVSSPTYFAKGGNVMGEAGPEAIIPLKRDGSGRLGISGGGSVSIVVNNNAHGTEARVEKRQEGGATIYEIIVEKVESQIWGNVARGSGVGSSTLANTYGLNRVAGSY